MLRVGCLRGCRPHHQHPAEVASLGQGAVGSRAAHQVARCSHLPRATLFGTPDYQTLLEGLQPGKAKKAGSGAVSPCAPPLLPDQAKFVQTRSPTAQKFVRLVEHWSDQVSTFASGNTVYH